MKSMERRQYKGPAVFSHGFRLFFLAGGFSAAALVPVWLHLFVGAGGLELHISALDWHIHEMIFGYVAAVVAGFLLTAIPNWTGRLPIAGVPLVVLFLLWLLGRVLMLSPLPYGVIAVGDSLFMATMTVVAAREVLTGKNWRNVPVCVLAGFFAISNILFHLEQLGIVNVVIAIKISLSIILLMVSLIGGRIIPGFTTNWLIKVKSEARPVPFGLYDKLVLLLTLLSLVMWSLIVDSLITGWLLVGVSVLHFIRLLRWKGWVPWRNALIVVLHIGYLWLPIGLALLGLSIVLPDMVLPSAAIHALTAGVMGMMTIAIMTRATLGHTGRELAAGPAGVMIYTGIFISVACRVAAPFLVEHYDTLLQVSGALWAIAFALFVVYFGRMMLLPRVS